MVPTLGAPKIPDKPSPTVAQAVGFAESAAVRDLEPVKLSAAEARKLNGLSEDRKLNELNEVPLKQSVAPITGARTFDDAIQSGELVSANIPAPSTTFDGLASSDNVALFGSSVLPSDDNIDVGPNHVVQTANLAFRVFNKSGAPLTPAAKFSSLFAPLGSPCGTRNDGDPMVLYDPLADRWLICQFCLVFNPNMHQLVAVSKTGDPTGQYYLYDFVMPNTKFFDYPHYAVWPDAYYMTTNQFNQAGTQFQGGGAFAFDRNKMLQGDPTASYIYFDEFKIDPTLGGELPTDIDGVLPPPVGTPNLFMEFRATAFGDPNDALRMFEFHADFANPANSTFTQKADLLLATFDASQPSSRNVVEQPPPATSNGFLDALADRMMHRIAYRTLAGGIQSYVLNFTVNVSGVTATSGSTYQAGIRWVELRRNAVSGAMAVNQQGTYAPGAGDGTNGRNVWMASIAQDYQGDIGLGFSASSLTQFPSIFYAGRLAGDPAGTLAQGEASMFNGSGSQQSSFGRWGDYSAMSVDPADECTFWYSNQYLNISANNDWRTRIGSFKVDPNCAAQQKATITGQVTNCQTGAAVQGAVVMTSDGFFRQTDASGNYSISVAPGTYTLNISKPGAGFNTCSGSVNVGAGGSASFNCCLQASPLIVASGASIVSESCSPANGVIDPGELVTLSFCVKNAGGLNTTNLVGTLQATGGVSTPSGPATYGPLVAGGASVCQNFAFTASGACGGTVTAAVQFQDGTTNLGTITYTFTLGTTKTAFSENFDGVTAPGLPAGWARMNAAGPDPVWGTSTNGPDTSPNDAFVNCPSVVSDKRLDSPAIAINSNSAQLSFRQSYQFTDSGSGFDGGVLELSSPNINGGAFTDVTNAAVGGTFVSNGYTSIIDSSYSSPLAGRQAWSGSSGGYITTKVNLGPNVAGQSIKLRWRMGSDVGGSDIGWFVDTIVITDGYTCCITPPACTISCAANITRSNDQNQCGAVVSYPSPLVGGFCTGYNCSPTSGAFFPKGATTVTCTTTNGPSCSFTVTVQDTQPPTITCPANVGVPSNCGPITVNYANPTVSDNCSGVGAPTCTPASGSTFPVGTTTVNCSVKDSSNNSATCNFTVTVTGGDTQPPTFSNLCRPAVNVSAAFLCPYATSAQVSYTNPAASDNCPGVTVACNPPSGSTFPLGTSTVTCTATDASNNTATCTFPVNIYSACLVDDTSPGNVVLFNASTGEYRYCCNGVVVAIGKGTVTGTGCDITIDHTKGNRKVHISVSSAGQGSGSAYVQKGTSQVCTITDAQMVGNVCACQ
ncbi:MAG TPA: HYR domain-containing protein [Blastocatellia bacterium]